MLLATLTFVALATSQADSPISYIKFKYGPNYFHMVQADIDSGKLSAQTVHTSQMSSVWKMIGKKQPAAAITGTFFSPRFRVPVADVLIEGHLVARGSRGTAVGVEYGGGVKIFDKPFMENVDWSDFQYGLRGGVRVISDGDVNPNPQAQKFRDKRIWGRAARTGIGLSKAGKLCLFATKNHVTLSEFGKAMKARGVENAVSLDGGGSTCFYYMGNMLIEPNRSLNNMFIITPSQ